MPNELDDFVINLSYDAFDAEYEEMQQLLEELKAEIDN